MSKRIYSDEYYVINLCDEILGRKARRQATFDFLRGDGIPGRKLPVDAYYPSLNLVIEYYERQHTETVTFFNRRMTVSGVSRGEQRKIYDQRRKIILPQHGIKVITISYSQLCHSNNKKLLRNKVEDTLIIQEIFNKNNIDTKRTIHDTQNTNISPNSKRFCNSNSSNWLLKLYLKHPVLVAFSMTLLLGFMSIGIVALTKMSLDAALPFTVLTTLIGVGISYHYTDGKIHKIRQCAKENVTVGRAEVYNGNFTDVRCPFCGSDYFYYYGDGYFFCYDCGDIWYQ